MSKRNVLDSIIPRLTAPLCGRRIPPSLARVIRAKGWSGGRIRAYMLRPVKTDETDTYGFEYSLMLANQATQMSSIGFKRSMFVVLTREDWPEGWEGLPEDTNLDDIACWHVVAYGLKSPLG